MTTAVEEIAAPATENEAPAELEVEPTGEFFFNRELSWLAFARRVLALAEDGELPLFERLKFAGIMGMLHDEFFMKRVSGLMQRMKNHPDRRTLGGLRPKECFDACRRELGEQTALLDRLLARDIRPAMAAAGVPIVDHRDLEPQKQRELR